VPEGVRFKGVAKLTLHAGTVEVCFELSASKKVVDLRVLRIVQPVECVDAAAAARCPFGPPSVGFVVPLGGRKKLLRMLTAS
jgi:hypothetical protein